jgi:hypothetical protein
LIVYLLISISSLYLAGCASSLPEGTITEDSAASSVESLEIKYLSDLDAVEMDYFASDKSAFLYLLNYCQYIADGSTPPSPDAIDSVVASYCDTELASAVGVTPPPAPPKGIDTEEFAKVALDKWGVGLPEEDGSSSDPVQLGMMVCEIDIDTMLSNLGDDFSGSFQEYALSTFCPEKLP